jgi:tetratricopeptide (TPR) repeat protein
MRLSQASIRFHRASNLEELHQYEEAEQLNDEALAIYASMRKSDEVRVNKVGVSVNNLGVLLALGKRGQARDLCERTVEISLELVTHENANVPIVYLLLARSVIHLNGAMTAQQGASDDAALPDGRVETLLRALCRASIDWLDLMGRLSDSNSSVPGGESVATTVQTSLSWLLRSSGRVLQATSLLADYYGRYASAQRLLLKSQGLEQAQDELIAVGRANGVVSQVDQLTLQLRGLIGSYQALARQRDEYLDADRNSSAFRQLEGQLAVIREQRLNIRSKLLKQLRQNRADLECNGSDDVEVTAQRLQVAIGQAPRALVLLLEINDSDGFNKAVALLFLGMRTQSFVAHIVQLPAQVLESLGQRRSDECRSSRGLNSTRGPQSAPDGLMLRNTVLSAWTVLEPLLKDFEEVHIGVHQRLGELPWQAVDDQIEERRLICVHHGVSAALRALGRRGSPEVGPPRGEGKFGVLAHTPSHPVRLDLDSENRLAPIPGVHADLKATQLVVGENHLLLRGRDALLEAVGGLTLLQLSCHGEPRSAHTGPGSQRTSAYELVMQLERHDAHLQACILVACSTARADENAWGESGGWSAALQDRCRLVLGALHPVADQYCTLFVLLLHRDWQELGDLKVALRRVRNRLRSGQWADSEHDLRQVQEQWLCALQAIPAGETIMDDARSLLRDRHDLYERDADLRGMVEGFVVFG